MKKIVFLFTVMAFFMNLTVLFAKEGNDESINLEKSKIIAQFVNSGTLKMEPPVEPVSEPWANITVINHSRSGGCLTANYYWDGRNEGNSYICPGSSSGNGISWDREHDLVGKVIITGWCQPAESGGRSEDPIICTILFRYHPNGFGTAPYEEVCSYIEITAPCAPNYGEYTCTFYAPAHIE